MIIDTEILKRKVKFIYDINCRKINCNDCKMKYGNLEYCPKSYADEFKDKEPELNDMEIKIDKIFNIIANERMK
jgi:hypothetical protein